MTRRLRIAFLCAALAAAALPANADDPPVTDRPRALEEIVVTAQKKEENIQDVPISITALSGDFLKEIGAADLHDVARFTPNVRFLTNAGGTHVFIRGFGTPFSSGAFDPSVGLVLDELSIGKQIHMSDPIYDIERFEVLRGPQGTLFGKNTPAGLFNVTTASPTEEFEGYVLGRIGGLGVHRVEAAIGGPLGKIAALRIAAVDSKQADDVRNTAPGRNFQPTVQQAARLKLELRPLDGLEVLVIGSRALTESAYYFHVQNYSVPDETMGFVRQYDPHFEDDPFDHQTSFDFADHLVTRDTDLLQANVRWTPGDLGWIRAPEVVAILGMTGFDTRIGFEVDFSPADILNVEPARNSLPYDQRSIEIRSAASLPGFFGFGDLDVLIGGLLFDADLTSDFPVIAGRNFDEYLLSPPAFELLTGTPAPGGVGFTDLNAVAAALGLPPPLSADVFDGDGGILFLRQETASQALFGRAAWRVFDHWELALGGRLTFERKRAHIRNTCNDPGLVCPILGIEEFDVREERSEIDFSPKVTLQYFPFDDLTLFATRAQGFKSGGFNNFGFTSAGLEVDSEKAVSWEAGAKGILFGAALSYAATLFWMDVDDLQLQDAVGGVVRVRNAGSARSRGVELDVQWLTPWEPLRLTGAAAYTDGYFKSFPNAPPIVASGVDSQDLSGRRLPWVPETQMNVTPELRVPFAVPGWLPFVARDLAFTMALDVFYRSNMYLDTDLDPKTLEDGHVWLNGRLGFATADEALSISAIVDNVTDVDALEYRTDSLVFPRGYVGIQEFRRNFAFQVRAEW